MSVVVPTRNEAAAVGELVRRIHAALAAREHEVVFVDDSDDGATPRRLADIARADPRVRAEHRDRAEGGLGGAVAHGLALARGRLVAVMDGDLQHPPEALPPLLAALEAGADVAVGSRFVPGGDGGGLPAGRRLVSAVARTLAHAAVPRTRWVRDVTSGLFALRREVAADLDLGRAGWKVLLEVLARGRYRTVAEVPIAFAPRADGRSKFGWRPARDYLGQLVRLAAHARRRRAQGRPSPAHRPES
ncbi:MAG: glycosyltransferase [Actinomycetia bacterium]|nr:glycosyltransferase [Actinomycetes bacterium]